MASDMLGVRMVHIGMSFSRRFLIASPGSSWEPLVETITCLSDWTTGDWELARLATSAGCRGIEKNPVVFHRLVDEDKSEVSEEDSGRPVKEERLNLEISGIYLVARSHAALHEHSWIALHS